MLSGPPILTADDLGSALWQKTTVSEALGALAAHAGLPLTDATQAELPSGLAADEMSGWIEFEADRRGFLAEPKSVALVDLDALLDDASPLLVWLRARANEPFLALMGRRGRFLLAMGPDRRRYRIRRTLVRDEICASVEAPLASVIDVSLSTIGLTPSRHARARAALLGERLAGFRVRDCWALRLSANASARKLVFAARVPHLVGIALAAHLIQYGLWLASWWLLGRSALAGQLERGWIVGWALLLLTLLPFRLLGILAQGKAVQAVGRLQRRRLLHGALNVDAQQVRAQGAGRLFTLAMEGAAIESLAITGGVQALYGLAELLASGWVLWNGSAGWMGVLLLTGWTVASGCLAWRYVGRRHLWTAQRLHVTHSLLESIIGHRTRAIQESAQRAHDGEDESLERYVGLGQRMDQNAVWVASVMPRGWLLVGIAVLAVDLVPGNTSQTEMAITLAGVFLAYRAFRRLAVGLTSVADTLIALRVVAPLVAAASRTTRASGTIVSAVPAAAGVQLGGAAVDVRGVMFRYDRHAEPVLRDCSLSIERGSSVLLEGPSGSGKSTLGLLVAGLRKPAAGIVLINGLDRSVVSPGAWRRMVALAPQSHDNYLLGGSLAFNLLMGRRWPPLQIDFEDAEAVCQELGLGELLDRMPSRLNQSVGETGWQLSQGERSRVYLARAILQRAEVLVLDETFSALDPESIDRVIRCVRRRATTVLAIAHT